MFSCNYLASLFINWGEALNFPSSSFLKTSKPQSTYMAGRRAPTHWYYTFPMSYINFLVTFCKSVVCREKDHPRWCCSSIFNISSASGWVESGNLKCGFVLYLRANQMYKDIAPATMPTTRAVMVNVTVSTSAWCFSFPEDSALQGGAGLRLVHIWQRSVTLQSWGRARRRAGMIPILGAGWKT